MPHTVETISMWNSINLQSQDCQFVDLLIYGSCERILTRRLMAVSHVAHSSQSVVVRLACTQVWRPHTVQNALSSRQAEAGCASLDQQHLTNCMKPLPAAANKDERHHAHVPLPTLFSQAAHACTCTAPASSLSHSHICMPTRKHAHPSASSPRALKQPPPAMC